ncbi:hypothetical protein Tco_1360637 [Tanacetum coccineum]
MGLCYPKDSSFELIAYSDADHAGCKDDCKCTSGGLQFLGGKLVSWSSKKQDCTVMSTAEAEYVSLSPCYAQVIWMRTQLLDYGFKYNRIPMYCDYKSAILRQSTLTSGVILLKNTLRGLSSWHNNNNIQLMFIQMNWCPPNKRYDSYGCNKKLDQSIDSSSCWIEKELTLTLDDFRTIFHLPQANDNNHASFLPPPSFSDMIWSSSALADVMQEYSPSALITRVTDGDNRRFADNAKYDDIMKNIFNFRKREIRDCWDAVPAWMIIDEIDRFRQHYNDVDRVCLGLVVTLTHSVDGRGLPRERIGHLAPLGSSNPATETGSHHKRSWKQQEARENVRTGIRDELGMLEPRSDKESLEVEIVQEKEEETTMVDVTNIVLHVNVDDEEDEITDEVFELRRRVKKGE